MCVCGRIPNLTTGTWRVKQENRSNKYQDVNAAFSGITFAAAATKYSYNYKREKKKKIDEKETAINTIQIYR